MKTHKLIDNKRVKKQILPKSAEIPKKLFKHRDRGIHSGRVRSS